VRKAKLRFRDSLVDEAFRCAVIGRHEFRLGAPQAQYAGLSYGAIAGNRL